MAESLAVDPAEAYLENWTDIAPLALLRSDGSMVRMPRGAAVRVLPRCSMPCRSV
ncbi:MAG: hypothetical protein U0Q21_02215 [Dermatophilaceae bacterium]